MSIPKEPRQLMINIMYLVLTALLALNVSAEIFNAFKMVDKGLIKSNAALDSANSALPAAIRDGAKKKASLQQYADLIDPGQQLSKDLDTYLAGIIDTLINQSGGYVMDPETGSQTTELIGKKNFDVTTRMLVNGPDKIIDDPDGPNGEDSKGAELKQKLLAYKKAMLDLVPAEDQAEFAKSMAVQIDEDTWKKSDKKTWQEFNFGHMPVQAVLPIFSKFRNDVKSTEAAFLNYLAGKVGTTTDVVIDKYAVVSAPDKSYIIKGEKYKAEIFLSAAASSDSKTGISVSVNGKKLPTNKEGIAVFETTPGSVGVKKYTANASLTNPVTGEVKNFKKEFSYEVGERSVAVSPLAMNVFYIGVDNPVSVTAAGVPSDKIKVSMGGSGGGTIKRGGGNYIVNVTKPTAAGQFAKVNVSAPGLNESRDFRVKRIPDPVPKLSKSRGGGMSSGEFKVQPGVFPILENFDFDAKCKIAGFRIVRVPKRQDPQVVSNQGGKFTSEAKALINKAKATDTYFFEEIKCKCPGDPANRDLGGMVFKIR